jgi:hypothetical protein
MEPWSSLPWSQNMSLTPTLSQTNPVHTLSSYYTSIHFNNIAPSTSSSSHCLFPLALIPKQCKVFFTFLCILHIQPYTRPLYDDHNMSRNTIYEALIIKSRESDWLRIERLRGRSSSPSMCKIFLFFGPQNLMFPMRTEGSFPGIKAAAVWSWPLISNQCRNEE